MPKTKITAYTRWDQCSQVHRVYLDPPPADGLGLIGWIARRRVRGTSGRECTRWVTGPHIFRTWPEQYERREDAMVAVMERWRG